jgi:DNA-binding CsgD family transcriptional regulator
MRGVVGREAERAGIERFLTLVADGPALMLLEGEPGIGKTTLLREAVAGAARRGVRVLSCTGSSTEARLAYSALTDLLAEIEPAAYDALPGLQRQSLDAALLRGGDRAEAADVDVRAVSAATLSVLRWLAARGPVVLAVDDLQWLDGPSARVVEYCTRRLPSRAGLLATRRTNGATVPVSRLAGLLDGARVLHLSVPGLPVEAMRELVRDRSPAALQRRTTQRIIEMAGGNPLYAVELLRGLPDEAGASSPVLPPSLAAMVRARLDGLGLPQRKVLLAVAAMAWPTLLLLGEALGPGVVEALEEPERRGLVRVERHRVSFTHPLLGEGVYAGATSAERREMHRALSEVAVDVEDRARHLAAARIVPDAVDALQEAALHLRARGAPDAAAEMLELALELGGEPALVVRVAEHRFDAGDARAAVQMLEAAVATLPAGKDRAEALMLLGEMRYKDDSFPRARELLEQAIAEAGADDRLVLMSELRLAFTTYNLGDMAEAAELGRRALGRATGLGDDALLAQALAVSVIVDFSMGRGLDEARLAKALDLQDPAQRTGAELYPGLIATFLYLWSGRFDEGRAQIDAVCAKYRERGEEQAMAWACFIRVWLESEAGDSSSTGRAAAEAHDRLTLLDTVSSRALALAAHGGGAAHAGRYDEARRACEESLALFARSGWTTWSWFPRSTLGALELAKGEPAAALAVLEPMIAVLEAPEVFDPSPGGFLFAGDVVEALVGAGRPEEARLLADQLVEGGRQLGRPWAEAVGGRGRGLVLAAEGDLSAAEAALEAALVAHDGVAMPVERARTLLVLGRVLRAQRQRRAAREVLGQARAIFAQVGSSLWRERVDEEIDRLGLTHRGTDELSASEDRVARLAASGLTNRQVADRLSISQKTVEAHLSRAYRKLGVRSRAELGARMAGPSQT